MVGTSNQSIPESWPLKFYGYFPPSSSQLLMSQWLPQHPGPRHHRRRGIDLGPGRFFSRLFLEKCQGKWWENDDVPEKSWGFWGWKIIGFHRRECGKMVEHLVICPGKFVLWISWSWETSKTRELTWNCSTSCTWFKYQLSGFHVDIS